MKTRTLHILWLAGLLLAAPLRSAAEEPTAQQEEKTAPAPAAKEGEPEKDDSAPAMDLEAETVTVVPQGKPLKHRFLPTSRRIDREIDKHRFVFKGEILCGLTISYGTLSTEDADMFPVFENIGLSGNITTVNPFAGYFYRDNNCIGVRLGYTHISGKLNSFDINLGEQNDLDIEIPWLDLKSNRYSIGLFHRSYVPIDEKSRFGVFGEFELALTMGDNIFAYKSGESNKRTKSENTSVKIWFNPGVAVYAFPNVCATISFGLGGFKYSHIRQFDPQGNEVGSRRYSKMNFRLNIADIKIGMTVHLWNKKKGNQRT